MAEVEPTGQSMVAKGAIVAEQAAAELTERTEVEVPTQSRVSTQLKVPLAQEERVKVQQPGSPNVLMPTSQIAEPIPTIALLSGKAPVTKVSLVQVSSSSSEKHVDYSGDEVDFGDEPALLDTSDRTHILHSFHYTPTFIV